MDLDPIKVGALPNDGTGDPLRIVSTKTNRNFAHVAEAVDDFGARLATAEETLAPPTFGSGTTTVGPTGTAPLATVRPGGSLNSYVLDLLLPPVGEIDVPTLIEEVSAGLDLTAASLGDATPVGIAVVQSTVRTVANASTTAASSDTYVAITSLTAPRTVTLPPASSFPRGKVLYVADESGNCSATLTITIAVQGSDTIAGQGSITMASPYQKLAFHSNGSNLWTYA